MARLSVAPPPTDHEVAAGRRACRAIRPEFPGRADVEADALTVDWMARGLYAAGVIVAGLPGFPRHEYPTSRRAS